MSKHFNIKYKGLSRDCRTNRWSLTCKSCNKTFEPETTIFSKQDISCPKCGTSETINYNDYEQSFF